MKTLKFEKEVKVSHDDKFKNKSFDIDKIMSDFELTYNVLQGLEGNESRVKIEKVIYKKNKVIWRIEDTTSRYKHISTCSVTLLYDYLGIEIELKEDKCINRDQLSDIMIMFHFKFMGFKRILFKCNELDDIPIILNCLH